MKFHCVGAIVVLALVLLCDLPGAEANNHTNPCRECEHYAAIIEAIPETNLTYEFLDKELKKLCDLLPPADQPQCIVDAGDFVSWLENWGIFVGKGFSPYSACAILGICDVYCCLLPYKPEQVHIAATGNPGEMTVSWVTGQNTLRQQVQWGLQDNQFTSSKMASTTTYTKGGWQGYIHQATLKNLQPNTTYYYRVGDPTWDWGNHNFHFVSPPNNVDQTYKFAVYGDMGASDASDATNYLLQKMAQTHAIDIILHAGDISYANGYQAVWDDYLRKVEYFAAYVPYMTAVGNHEIPFNFTAFKHRFDMPGAESGSNTNMYFSFNYGSVHVIAINFEEDLGLAPDMEPGKPQYEWLQNDLQKANQNRANVPWIVMYMHRPLYCSNGGLPCDIEGPNYRKRIEQMVYDNKVDLVVGAHLHSYERMTPIYQDKAIPGYNNPQAPVYVVIGTGGNKEGYSYFPPNPPSWSVTRLSTWGVGLMTVNGGKSLTFQFIESDSEQVLDQFTITKSN